jgi:hypothetical protein
MSIKEKHPFPMYKLVLAFITLLSGLSMTGLASDPQDEAEPPLFERVRIVSLSCFESRKIPEEGITLLPPELISMIVSPLPRWEQVSMRCISHGMKDVIDGYVWPSQSARMEGEC